MDEDRTYYRLAFKIFADLSGTIAVPAVLGAMSGKWLDAKLGTKPWMLFTLLILAFGFSAVSLVKKTTLYGREFEKVNKQFPTKKISEDQ